jgi:hypothetical protein
MRCLIQGLQQTVRFGPVKSSTNLALPVTTLVHDSAGIDFDIVDGGVKIDITLTDVVGDWFFEHVTQGTYKVTLPATSVSDLGELRLSLIADGCALTTEDFFVVTPAAYEILIGVYDVKNSLYTIQGANFNQYTDSLEAIRDRGDLAWCSGAGGTADRYYFPCCPIILDIPDHVEGGTYTDLARADGSYVSIREVDEVTNSLDFNIEFMLDPGVIPSAVHIWGWYSGNYTHWMYVQAEIDGTDTWETVGTIPHGEAGSYYAFPLTPEHIDPTTNTCHIRFVHNTVPGVQYHVMYLDKIMVTAHSQSDTSNLLTTGLIVVGPGKGSVKYEDTFLGRNQVPLDNVLVRAFPYVNSLADFSDIKGMYTTDEHGTFHLWLDPGQYVLTCEKNGTVVYDSIITVTTPV